eukprot:snap_masked-scaffold_52-processed-gene-1.36-mRNA-1 protein AED:0.99 eAED:1.00 QI:0/-1/0/1/-1/1/1/0/423
MSDEKEKVSTIETKRNTNENGSGETLNGALAVNLCPSYFDKKDEENFKEFLCNSPLQVDDAAFLLKSFKGLNLFQNMLPCELFVVIRSCRRASVRFNDYLFAKGEEVHFLTVIHSGHAVATKSKGALKGALEHLGRGSVVLPANLGNNELEFSSVLATDDLKLWILETKNLNPLRSYFAAKKTRLFKQTIYTGRNRLFFTSTQIKQMLKCFVFCHFIRKQLIFPSLVRKPFPFLLVVLQGRIKVKKSNSEVFEYEKGGIFGVNAGDDEAGVDFIVQAMEGSFCGLIERDKLKNLMKDSFQKLNPFWLDARKRRRKKTLHFDIETKTEPKEAVKQTQQNSGSKPMHTVLTKAMFLNNRTINIPRLRTKTKKIARKTLKYVFLGVISSGIIVGSKYLKSDVSSKDIIAYTEIMAAFKIAKMNTGI